MTHTQALLIQRRRKSHTISIDRYKMTESFIHFKCLRILSLSGICVLNDNGSFELHITQSTYVKYTFNETNKKWF